jgi:hypothetical protein
VTDLQSPETRTHGGELEQFKKLIEEQRSLLVKNEFDRIYDSGRVGMNAFTYYDLTANLHHGATPTSSTLVLDGASACSIRFREFYAERDVVFENAACGQIHAAGQVRGGAAIPTGRPSVPLAVIGWLPTFRISQPA